MKPISKIAGAVAILFLISIAPYLSEKLVPEAQALRGRGAAFAVGVAVGSASTPAPAPTTVVVTPAPAPPPQTAPPQQ